MCFSYFWFGCISNSICPSVSPWTKTVAFTLLQIMLTIGQSSKIFKRTKIFLFYQCELDYLQTWHWSSMSCMSQGACEQWKPICLSISPPMGSRPSGDIFYPSRWCLVFLFFHIWFKRTKVTTVHEKLKFDIKVEHDYLCTHWLRVCAYMDICTFLDF